MAQTLCICRIWMYEVVWGENQPQLWRCGIIFTTQVNLTSQIWGQLGWCTGIRVHPYALETAYQWLKHFVYSLYGCMKRFKVGISLKHDVRYHHFYSSILKWTTIPGTVVKVLNEEKNYVTVENKWDRECLRVGDSETSRDKLMRSKWNSNEHDQGTWRENLHHMAKTAEDL